MITGFARSFLCSPFSVSAWLIFAFPAISFTNADKLQVKSLTNNFLVKKQENYL